jgi:hypothetical protein
VVFSRPFDHATEMCYRTLQSFVVSADGLQRMRVWSVDRYRRHIDEYQVSLDHCEFEGPATDIGSEFIDPPDVRPNVSVPANNLNDFDVFKSSKSSSVWWIGPMDFTSN